ncbi:hypothetical protein CL634_07230 [bacterium]|nr:hypothetical protein [bacterium]|tara:strand:+ start:441 stop:779 length:339 start_codon:yes stop_codon:yes gene_type:complete
MNHLKPGRLVVIITDGLNLTPDGFATGSSLKDGGLRIYENIDLSAYPSCYDFKGESTAVRTGDIGTVCEFIGRPHCINTNPQWFCYDIYEIFIHGEIRQIFKQNIYEFWLND